MKQVIIIIIIIILVAILVLGGYYLYTLYFAQPPANTNTALSNQFFVVNTNTSQTANINSADSQPQINISKDDNSNIQFLAKIFSQNFGSYSNQQSLTNFDEIYSFMSEKMKQWVQNTYKKQILELHPLDKYYAITTKVLFVEINKLDEGNNTAEVLVKTQRQEFIGNPDQPDVFYQDLLLNLVKVGGNWIVDGAYWQ